MNIEEDIFDYLQTTALEPHDDYTSEITYKDQKIIWNRLKEQDKEIERLNNIITELEKWLQSEYDRYFNDKENLVFSNVEVIDFHRVLDKLKELKELFDEGEI